MTSDSQDGYDAKYVEEVSDKHKCTFKGNEFTINTK